MIRRSTTPLPLLLAALSGCGDLIVDGRGLTLDATGTVQGVVRLDADGNGVIGGQDPALGGVGIRLLTVASGTVVDTVTTAEDGTFVLPAVPVGEFRLELDPTTLPPDAELLGPAPQPFLLALGQTVQAAFGLRFPEFSPSEVRELEPGRQLFTRGIVLNVRNQPGDGVVHIREGASYLRITEVAPVTLTIGDSVRVLGRTAVGGTQPILEEAFIFRLVQSAAVALPVNVTTGQAARAAGGSLDAALVRIDNATILATEAEGGSLVVTVDDGSGPVDLVLREFINFNRGTLVPGVTFVSAAAGLLVPRPDGAGGVRWRMTPRATTDLVVMAVPSL